MSELRENSNQGDKMSDVFSDLINAEYNPRLIDEYVYDRYRDLCACTGSDESLQSFLLSAIIDAEKKHNHSVLRDYNAGQISVDEFWARIIRDGAWLEEVPSRKE